MHLLCGPLDRQLQGGAGFRLEAALSGAECACLPLLQPSGHPFYPNVHQGVEPAGVLCMLSGWHAKHASASCVHLRFIAPVCCPSNGRMQVT